MQRASLGVLTPFFILSKYTTVRVVSAKKFEIQKEVARLSSQLLFQILFQIL
jgi:hypothetical protein